MADILESIKRTLEDCDLKYTLWQGESRTRFELGFSGRSASFAILIHFKEGNSVVHLLAPKLAVVRKDHPGAKEIYAKLLAYNYEWHHIKFSVDEEDGEIVCEASLPLPRDGSFPSEALARVLSAMARALFEELPRLLQMVYGQSASSGTLVDEVFEEIVRGIEKGEDGEGEPDE